MAVAILGTLTAAAIRFAKQRPYLVAGWLWYLGIMVPVIGLVQVRSQARADRYMYVPLVGLSIPAVWGVADWAANRPRLKHPLAVGAAPPARAATTPNRKPAATRTRK